MSEFKHTSCLNSLTVKKSCHIMKSIYFKIDHQKFWITEKGYNGCYGSFSNLGYGV